jgi:hypothetical protein
VDPNSIILDSNVVKQLHELVTAIASLYCDNLFHNIEHASHVTMSVAKLLNRVVAPEKVMMGREAGTNEEENMHLVFLTIPMVSLQICSHNLHAFFRSDS